MKHGVMSMRQLLACALIALLIGCSTATEHERSSTPVSPLPGLPVPSALARTAPPRVSSGAHSPLVHTLRSDGAEYAPFPGWSANAEVSGLSALIHGVPD